MTASVRIVRRIIEAVVPARMGVPFRWNLASVWTSNLGDGVALAAGPLLVASLTRDPTLIAAAMIVQRLPTLLLGLFAGAIADRVDRRTLVITANFIRAVILLALAAVIATGHVTIAAVLGILFLVGIAEEFADSGTRAILPMLVSRADLGIGNARNMAGYLVANQLIGPPVGAFLFAAGRALPFGTQAAAMLLAAWLFSRVQLPRGGVRGQVTTHVLADIGEGLRWIRGNAPVRTLAIIIFAFNITWGAPWGILVYWAQERLGLGPVGFGMLTTATAIGGIGSVLAYDWLEQRIPLSTLMKVVLTMEVLTHLALALTTNQWVAMVIMVVFGAYAFVWGSLSGAIRQRATPTEFQGRVGSVYWFGLVVGLLVGQFLGGLIARQWGAAAPFWFAFAGSALTLILVWRSLTSIAHAGATDEDAGPATV